MIKKSQQINKGSVKKQINKELVWECLMCGKKEITTKRPEHCQCSQAKYVVNNQYTVKE